MARLEDSGNKGLPASPAPPRRDANPWRLSVSARKPEQQSQPMTGQLLEELIRQAPVDDGPVHGAPAHEATAHEAPVREKAPPLARASHARPGLLFLVIAGIVIVVALRIFFEARTRGDWSKLIGPLVLIAFIAHGWWRARQRSEAKKTMPD